MYLSIDNSTGNSNSLMKTRMNMKRIESSSSSNMDKSIDLEENVMLHSTPPRHSAVRNFINNNILYIYI